MTVPSTLRQFVNAVPATAKLVVRLTRDQRVDRRYRIAAAAAVAYAAWPLDLIPDRIPVFGKIDDAAVVVIALTRLVDAAGPKIVAEHWDADPESLDALLGLLAAAERFVPKRLRLAASVVS